MLKQLRILGFLAISCQWHRARPACLMTTSNHLPAATDEQTLRVVFANQRSDFKFHCRRNVQSHKSPCSTRAAEQHRLGNCAHHYVEKVCCLLLVLADYIGMRPRALPTGWNSVLKLLL